MKIKPKVLFLGCNYDEIPYLKTLQERGFHVVATDINPDAPGMKLADSEIIDIKNIPITGKVIFGTTVTLYNIDTEKSVTYQIVGEDEADVKNSKISVGSPISRAMMGKEEGDEITVQAPSGDVQYEIEKVEHL